MSFTFNGASNDFSEASKINGTLTAAVAVSKNFLRDVECSFFMVIWKIGFYKNRIILWILAIRI
jgi:hypothetical protein